MIKYEVMKQETIERIQSKLLGDVVIESRSVIEQKYPERQLPAGAIVTRSAPSPTGFVHIGTIYMCLLNQFLARQTGGVYMLRVEDTDKKREISDGVTQIVDALTQFSLVPDEGVLADSSSYGNYGPYLQSERKGLYLSYAVELLKNGRAYPCFATKDELDKNYEEQQRAKVRPGYYGTWALWREKTDEDINAALDAGKDFVLRFRSEGSHEKRVSFEDALKGHLELPENDLDVPLIKNDGSQLPTYHLAHVVDDYLMKTNIILRGDEWLPSTPLHMELSDALGMPRFRYAHFAPISVLDKGGKRKLSKRKDPEADVQFWLSVGYPLKGVKAYLLGLANSNFEEWYREHSSDALEDFAVSLEKLAASRAPLLDHSKLNDYCKDVIAAMPQGDFTRAVLDFSASHVAVREDAVTTSNTFNTALLRDAKYTNEVLSLERAGDKPRKDIAKWNDAYEQYGYFFDEEFEKNFKPGIAAVLGGLEKHANSTCMAFLKTYNPGDEQPVWFEKLKHAAESAGFCVDNKAYREDQKLPESERKYIGNTADFAKILRVRLTGKDRTPDLCAIMKVMQHERVVARLGS